MDDRRKHSEFMGYALMILLFLMFLAVLFIVTWGSLKETYGALVGGYGTTILGMFAVAVGFVWGSSRGSQLKDAAMANAPRTPAPPAPPAPALQGDDDEEVSQPVPAGTGPGGRA